jgi:uridylate kinase
MQQPLSYKRILVKFSGEALLGDQPSGIDERIVTRLADEIAEIQALGVNLGIVIGGGNIYRGMEVAKSGGNRVTGDQMGMLATIMNALVLRDFISARGIACQVFSAIPVPTICETFSQRAARAAFDAGQVVIFAAGVGHPFFTTDSGAALRAAEMGCEALFKATTVDGIYSADPKLDPLAERYEKLTHAEVLAKGLNVMDAAAIAIAQDNNIPVLVFSMSEPGAIIDILKGHGRATVVTRV